MSIVDPNRLVGADAAGFHRLGEQPLPISFESGEPGLGQLPTGPFATACPKKVGRFHVKQVTPPAGGVTCGSKL